MSFPSTFTVYFSPAYTDDDEKTIEDIDFGVVNSNITLPSELVMETVLPALILTFFAPMTP